MIFENETNKQIIKKASEILTQIYKSGLNFDSLVDTAIKNFNACSITEIDETMLDIDFGDFIATFRKLKGVHPQYINCINTDLKLCKDIELFLRVSDDINAELFSHNMTLTHDKTDLKLV